MIASTGVRQMDDNDTTTTKTVRIRADLVRMINKCVAWHNLLYPDNQIGAPELLDQLLRGPLEARNAEIRIPEAQPPAPPRRGK